MCYAQERNAIDWRTDVVEDRPPADVRRRCSTGKSSNPIVVIGRSWERSLLPPPAFVTLERPEIITAAASPPLPTAFDPAWHWDHLFVDIPPFRYIAEKYEPPSVLDLGCGVGAYLTLFDRLGSHTVFGVDGIPANATVLGAEHYAVRDLSKSIDLGRTFDLVICVEVAEHLEEQYEDHLLDTIARHADNHVIFSAAEPGQPGNGHINCKTISYWLERWASRGWIPDLMDSLGMRSLASLSWFRRNLVVLRKGNLDDHREALCVLGAIGARPFNWYDQLPGIRDVAFMEVPPPLAGYMS
jgi:SAM-dependent methyltransferase